MTQKEALDILKTGRNVFLTGPAGSGKTFVLKKYIDYLRNLGADFGITASTGIAATHLGGITIHSWSGIGIRDSLDKSELNEIVDKKHVRKKVRDAKTIIIDEVSMLHHFRLDLIDKIIKEVKNSSEPFGGMQVVFCGDFFQLPPVRKVGEKEALFAYHSSIWDDLNLKICYISEQHRQKDAGYLDILNDIRSGVVNEQTKLILQSRFDKKIESESTKLYTHNIGVDSENHLELDKISGQIFEYQMREIGNRRLIEGLKKGCLAPEDLRLKVGARVMFVKNNFEEGYVNGTLGVITKCGREDIEARTVSGKIIKVERESWVVEEDGKIKAEISQYPLRLAWAITIHKSQGMSLDSALIDLSKSFEKGMGYVALSRVRSLEGLFLKGLNEKALQIDREVLDFDEKFKKLSETNSFHIRTMGEEKIFKMHKEFANKVTNDKNKTKKRNTLEETVEMLNCGMGIKEISKKRGLKMSTILDHIEEIRHKDSGFNVRHLQNSMPKTKFRTIYNTLRKIGLSNDGKYRLAPAKELLGPKYSYEELRLVRLFL